KNTNITYLTCTACGQVDPFSSPAPACYGSLAHGHTPLSPRFVRSVPVDELEGGIQGKEEIDLHRESPDRSFLPKPRLDDGVNQRFCPAQQDGLLRWIVGHSAVPGINARRRRAIRRVLEVLDRRAGSRSLPLDPTAVAFHDFVDAVEVYPIRRLRADETQ